MSGLIWIQTVLHYDGILKDRFENVDFEKNLQRRKVFLKIVLKMLILKRICRRQKRAKSVFLKIVLKMLQNFPALRLSVHGHIMVNIEAHSYVRLSFTKCMNAFHSFFHITNCYH